MLLLRYTASSQTHQIRLLESLRKARSVWDRIPDPAMVEQRSSDWFALRKCTISGSIAHHIAGARGEEATLSAFKAVFELNKPVYTEDMKRGADGEDTIRELLASQKGLRLQTAGICVHSAFKYLTFSPDALTDDGSFVEIKYPRQHYESKEKAIAAYRHQLQHGMLIMNVEQCLLTVYDGSSLCVYDVEASHEWREKALKRYEAFYTQWLQWYWERDFVQGAGTIAKIFERVFPAQKAPDME